MNKALAILISLSACVAHDDDAYPIYTVPDAPVAVDTAAPPSVDAAVPVDAPDPRLCTIRATRTTKPVDVVTIDLSTSAIPDGSAIVLDRDADLVVGSASFTTAQVTLVLSSVPITHALVAIAVGGSSDVVCRADVVTN